MRGAKMTEIDHARALAPRRSSGARSTASFAEAPRGDVETTCDLLTIRVGGDAYALRLAEVGGLFVDRVVTPLPTLVPELVGIAGFRAALVPVYDLRAPARIPARRGAEMDGVNGGAASGRPGVRSVRGASSRLGRRRSPPTTRTRTGTSERSRERPTACAPSCTSLPSSMRSTRAP